MLIWHMVDKPRSDVDWREIEKKLFIVKLLVLRKISFYKLYKWTMDFFSKISNSFCLQFIQQV